MCKMGNELAINSELVNVTYSYSYENNVKVFRRLGEELERRLRLRV